MALHVAKTLKRRIMKTKNIFFIALLFISLLFIACPSSGDGGGDGEDYSGWTKSADGNTLRLENSSSYNIKVPVFAVSAAKGFSVRFTSYIPVEETPFDWYAYVLTASDTHDYYSTYYNVTIPNLSISDSNIYGSYFGNYIYYPYKTGAWFNEDKDLQYTAAFDATVHYIKISFKSDSISFYIDAVPWIIYSTADTTFPLKSFINRMATALNSGELVFNSACLNLTDVVFEKN